VVVAKGDLVTDIEIGDHAGVKWINGTCLACDFCQQSDEPLCSKALLSGYTVDGTFQQYCIAKAAHVARIPKECALDAIAPVLCAGITVYKGLKESGVKPGQWVAIVGAGGGLGSLACQYAKAMGCRVIGIDTGDEKKKMVTELGGETFIDFATSKNLVADVQKATPDGLGPHAVILVAVNEKPFQQAAEYVRSRGTVICIGLPAGAYLKAPVFESVIKMIRIQGKSIGVFPFLYSLTKNCRLLCRQPQGQRGGDRVLRSWSYQSTFQGCWSFGTSNGLRQDACRCNCRTIRS
jgi:propanol-preferring alcohol dehydrogenase